MKSQEPATATERVVARAWCETLELDRVDVTDNFFDLGGHSLLLHAVRAVLVRELGRDVVLVDLFRHPTVRSAAAHLDGASARPDRTARPGTAAGRGRLRTRRARDDEGARR